MEQISPWERIRSHRGSGTMFSLTRPVKAIFLLSLSLLFLFQAIEKLQGPFHSSSTSRVNFSMTNKTDDHIVKATVLTADSIAVLDNIDYLFQQNSTLRNFDTVDLDLVIVFVDASYLDTLSIWLHYYKLHTNPQSKRVLCLVSVGQIAFEKIRSVMQQNTDGILDGLGPTILTVIAPNADNQKNVNLAWLWKLRVKLMDRLLRSFNCNLLFSDVDAVWMKDPDALFSVHKESDIVASRGVFPQECPLLDAATAVFGFLYLRNTQSSHRISHKMVETIDGYESDDQRALNCVLAKREKLLEEKTKKLTDGSFTLHYAGSLAVTVLPHEQVRRNCAVGSTALATATVLHCNSQKNGNSKQELFKRLNLMPLDKRKHHWPTIIT